MQAGILVDGEYDLDAQTWLSLAVECDQSGIDALMRSDHFTPSDRAQEYGSLEAWASCAAAAVATHRIKIGTLVSPVTFRHPSLLAKAVLTVDQLSGGRAELGLGTGWNEAEHRAYGFDFPRAAVRYEQLEEQLEILLLMWGPAPHVSFTGRHYALSGCTALPKPVRRPRLIVGKRGRRRSVEIATRWADEYNCVFVTPSACSRLRRLLDDSCAQLGRERPLALSVTVDVVVGADRRELHHKMSRLASRRPWIDPETFLDNAPEPFLIGNPPQVIRRLEEYAKAGVSRVFLKHGCADDLDSIRLIGTQVLPALRHAGPP